MLKFDYEYDCRFGSSTTSRKCNNDSQDYQDLHDFGSGAENRMAVLKEAEQYGAVLRVLRIAEHRGAFL